MKQHIVVKQLNELSKEEKEKLLIWHWGKIRYPDKRFNVKWGKQELPLLSIGQMIEFLFENTKELEYPARWFYGQDNDVVIRLSPEVKKRQKKLCDALWKAVKEVLEK